MNKGNIFRGKQEKVPFILITTQSSNYLFGVAIIASFFWAKNLTSIFQRILKYINPGTA